MFSLIRANERRSIVLIGALLVLLVVTGAAIGEGFVPSGWKLGVGLALAVWIGLLLVSVAGGEKILLSQAGATEVPRASAPELFNIVEEMQIASGLKAMPRICVINTAVPNAFAVGLEPDRAAIAVTSGLLARLNRDELQGVVAHEIAHIVNRDTQFMTLAGTTVGAIALLADQLRHVRLNGYGRRSRDNGAGLLLALLVVLLAPLFAQLLYFACSRRREYLADACAAQFTRYPEGLASALEKIAGGQIADEETSRVLAPLYIVSPLAAAGAGTSLFSTHPPAAERIRILRGMGRSASLAAYERASAQVRGGRGVFRPGELAGDAEVPAREVAAVAVPAPQPAWRQAKHALHTAAGLRTVHCACGAVLKLPPALAGRPVPCPRCGAAVPGA